MTNEAIIKELGKIARIDAPEVKGNWNAPAGKFLDPKDAKVKALVAQLTGLKPIEIMNLGAAKDAASEIEFHNANGGKAKANIKAGRFFQTVSAVRTALKAEAPKAEEVKPAA